VFTLYVCAKPGGTTATKSKHREIVGDARKGFTVPPVELSCKFRALRFPMASKRWLLLRSSASGLVLA
jgi:hypothetical protein